jgi:AcrR family transcriptional regulator
LRAAAREFARRGFAGTSLARIGQLAGVTKGGVYFHFRSKEELFLEVLAAQRAQIREAEVRPQGRTAAAQLEEFLGARLRACLKRPEARVLLRLHGTEVRAGFDTTLRGDARSELRALRARLREFFSAGQRDGSLLVEDPALSAFVVAGAVEGILEQTRIAPRDAEPFGGAESLAAAIVAPYLTGESAARRPPPAPPSDEGDFQPPF